MDGGGTRLRIVEVVTAPSLRRARRQPTRFAGRGSGGSTGDVRPPRHRDAAGASSSGIGDDPDTHSMDIKGARSRPGVMNPGRWRGGRILDSDGRRLQ